MRPRLLIVILLALAAAGPARAAGSADALYQRGNQLFQEGDYQAAAEAYHQAVEAGGADAFLFYNLGATELRRGRLGHAIANFMRAKILAPRDEDVKFNLVHAKEMVAIKPPDTPVNFVQAAFVWTAGHLSANEWALALIVLYWTACISGAALLTLRSRKARPVLRMVLFSSIITGAIALPFGAYQIKADLYTPRAVIVADRITARSGPGEGNDEQFELAEGMDVVVEKCLSGWCEVRARGGFIGWVPADAFERL